MKQRIRLLLALIGAICYNSIVGVSFTTAGVTYGMTFLDLNVVKENADIIVVGTLDLMLAPYEVLGKNFYRIRPDVALKGSFATNIVLVIETNIDSSEGRPAMVEPSCRYMLFLKRTDLSREGLPRQFSDYRLIGNWKGIVALDKTARERRAVRRIEEQHGIKIDDMPDTFVEAIKASFVDVKDGALKNNGEKMDISDGASAIFDALNLQLHEKKIRKHPHNVH